MRYVGSSTNPHGLTVATMPRRNDRPRFTAQQDSAMRARSSSPLDRTGRVDDRAVGGDEQRDRVGDDVERVGRATRRDRAAARTSTPRSAANRVIVVDRVERVDADEAHLVADLGVDGGEVGQLRAHGGARRVPQVDDHRPAVGGAARRADRRRRLERQRRAGGRSAAAGSSAPPGSTYSPGSSSTASGAALARRPAAPHHGADGADDDGGGEHEQRGTGPSQPHQEATERRPGSRATRRRRPRAGRPGVAGPGGGTDRSGRSARLDRSARRQPTTTPSSSTMSSGRGCLGGRPHGRLLRTMRPLSSSSPPQTPHGSSRSIGLAEAGRRQRALGADRLGAGDVDDVVGEEERGQRAVAIRAAGRRARERRRDWLRVSGGRRWRTWCSSSLSLRRVVVSLPARLTPKTRKAAGVSRRPQGRLDMSSMSRVSRGAGWNAWP